MNLNMNTTSACNDMLFASAKVTPHRKDKQALEAGPTPGTAATPAASTGAVDPANTAAPQIQGQFGPDDMQALMSEWGQANSRYDLNADGTVNVDDLVAMIMNWQTTPADPQTGDPADVLTDPAEIDSMPTLQPVKIEPSTDGRRQTAGLATESSTIPSASDPAASTSPSGPAGTTSGSEQTGNGSPLDGLVGSWGQNGTPYDFDGNGVVDADDLIHMILNWGAAPSSTAAAQAAASTAVPSAAADVASSEPMDTDKPGRTRSVEDARAARLAKARLHDRDRDNRDLSANALATVTTSLVDRLMSAGFTDRPPANLRNIVDSLNLSPHDSKSVMRSLRQAYPEGLGVNVRV